MNNIDRLIVIRGLSPELNLGIEWECDENTPRVNLSTEYNKKIISLGKMPLTLDNFKKIRDYTWAYLVQDENKKWKPIDFVWEEIPRVLNVKEEIIDVVGIGFKSEGSEDDGLLF